MPMQHERKSQKIRHFRVFAELFILELRPILPTVTALALLVLWPAFPAVTPTLLLHPPANGNAPRVPLERDASPPAGLHAGVSFHAF